MFRLFRNIVVDKLGLSSFCSTLDAIHTARLFNSKDVEMSKRFGFSLERYRTRVNYVNQASNQASDFERKFDVNTFIRKHPEELTKRDLSKEELEGYFSEEAIYPKKRCK